MEISQLQEQEIADFQSLIQIFKEVFEHKDQLPGNEHLQKLLTDPDFIVFVVRSEGKVVGGLTIYVLHQYYSVKPLAYTYDVGIAPEFQRQGLGKKLISAVADFCSENGFEQAFVEAESDDFEAISFIEQHALTLR